ncbi:MAG: carbamoyl phosphate synthase small subunit, partial [Sphingomonadaceae bacterium]|nr:carbamoyl phosphate synthase small subunit [Sphingomonadaceae bacterium]
MADAALLHAPQPAGATGVLVLADGHVVWGHGFGAEGAHVGEVCFNTAMTGYQEVMTDPSYAGQIVTFTFPHIGNVGVNTEDLESQVEGAVGCVVRESVTAPSNFRSEGTFEDWLAAKGKIGLSGVDTRALTRRIRLSGAPNAVIAHSKAGKFDLPALLKKAQEWPGLEGMDLARVVSRTVSQEWEGGTWALGKGYARSPHSPRPHVVALDFGAKDNIFRSLDHAGAHVTVVPGNTALDAVLALEPAGVF